MYYRLQATHSVSFLITSKIKHTFISLPSAHYAILTSFQVLQTLVIHVYTISIIYLDKLEQLHYFELFHHHIQYTGLWFDYRNFEQGTTGLYW